MNNIKVSFLVNFLLFVLLSSPVFSQNLFTNLSTQEGLSHKTVYCLFEDSKGYMWIGSTNGLNRYDGYTFKTFFYDEKDSSSICGNFITEIVEDTNGLLWIATTNGYCYYNPVTEKFKKVHFPQMKEPIIPERLCVGKNGIIWGISRGNILSKMNYDDPNIGMCYTINSLYTEVPSFQTWSIDYVNDSLWICTSVGILKLHEATLRASILKCGTYNFNSIKEIKTQNNQKLIFVDMGDNIYEYDNELHTVIHTSKETFYKTSENFKYLTDAVYDNSGNIWITASPGLFKLSKNGRLISTNKQTGSNIDFDNIRTNWCITDTKGNVWIGTMDFGVFILNNSNKPFSHLAIAEGKNFDVPISDYIMIGNEKFYSSSYGAFCIKPNKTSHIKLIHEPVQSIFQLTNNEIIFVGNETVFKYYRDKGTIEKFIAHTSYIHNSHLDTRNVLWLMSWGRGVEGVDLRTLKRYKIDIDTVDNNKNIVYTMFDDDKGSLWLGMFGNGLIEVKNPISDNPIVINHSIARNNANSGANVILALHNDQNGNIWIGTNGGGLEKYTKKTKQFTSYTTKQGLFRNVVESINSDVHGNIWFTTTVVSKYDITKNKFIHYDFSNGINSKYFQPFTSKDEHGIIYFGDDAGLLTFDPLKIKEKEVPKIPNFTSFEIFGSTIKAGIPFEEIIPLIQSIDYTKSIELPYNYNSITFEYASLHILDNKSISYAYILDGAENRWNYSKIHENTANYSGLNPGEYVFSIILPKFRTGKISINL